MPLPASARRGPIVQQAPVAFAAHTAWGVQVGFRTERGSRSSQAPAPIAIVQEGLSGAEAVSRLTQILAEHPEAQIRAGRKGRSVGAPAG